MKCLTCDQPCLIVELTGCPREDCPHLTQAAFDLPDDEIERRVDPGRDREER